MGGQFRLYRRRRVLPFAAAWCLVFLNGATLQPFAAPPELLDAVATSADDVAGVDAADSWRWLRYERRHGEEMPPSVVANIPPIVKNLRRPAPTRYAKALARVHESRPGDAPGPKLEYTRRESAANATDLTRLCRLLL